MKISVVTPSINQGEFIERTINSVLNQKGAFQLEYIVIDGGSADSTRTILKKYQNQLRWISEPDKGQSDAINKGFRLATGDIFAWLNSDDTFEPNSLALVVKAFQEHSCEWCFGTCRIIDENDFEIRRFITQYKHRQSMRYSFDRLLRRNFISQPATFFSRKAYETIGEIDTGLSYAMDYDYWLRLGLRYPPHFIDFTLANFRCHQKSKTGLNYRHGAREAFLAAKRHAPKGSGTDLTWHFLHYLVLSVLYRFL
jgi:glycosyltransferase involved in cell wall biosynthesis